MSECYLNRCILIFRSSFLYQGGDLCFRLYASYERVYVSISCSLDTNSVCACLAASTKCSVQIKVMSIKRHFFSQFLCKRENNVFSWCRYLFNGFCFPLRCCLFNSLFVPGWNWKIIFFAFLLLFLLSIIDFHDSLLLALDYLWLDRQLFNKNYSATTLYRLLNFTFPESYCLAVLLRSRSWYHLANYLVW